MCVACQATAEPRWASVKSGSSAAARAEGPHAGPRHALSVVRGEATEVKGTSPHSVGVLLHQLASHHLTNVFEVQLKYLGKAA